RRSGRPDFARALRVMWLPLVMSVALAQAEHHDDRLETGRRLTQSLLDSRLDELWEQAGPSFKRAFGGRAGGLKGFRAKLAKDFGDELRVTAEQVDEREQLVVYSRQSTFSRWARGVELQWVWDPS